MTGTSKDFNCNDAAALLGYPGAEVGPCLELLPGLWRVVLKGPDVAPEGARVETFVWNDGARASASGPSALASYLRRIGAHSLETVDPYALQILLEATAGAPPGFTAGSVAGQIDGISGGVTTRPLGISLVQNHWQQPAGTNDPGQPPPPSAPGPLGPPPGAPPPGMAPPGAPPPGMGPPGGAAPSLVAKATLVLDAEYQGAWTVVVRRPFAQSFETVLTIPVAP